VGRKKISLSTKVILCLLGLSLISIFYQMGLKNICIDVLDMKNTFIEKTITSLEGKNLYSPKIIEIDWNKKYPFSDNPEYEQVDIYDDEDNTITWRTLTVISKVSSKLEWIWNQFDKYSSEYFMGKEVGVWVVRWMNRCLGMNLVVDGKNALVFEQEDGCLMSEMPYKDMEREARNVIEFDKWLSKKGIDLLYVQEPSPVDKYSGQNFAVQGYKEYSNRMADELLEMLGNSGVDYIDMREELYLSNQKYEDVYFATDHHWIPESGLWAAGIVADRLNKMYGFQINEEIYDISNYSENILKEKYMGSYGGVLTSVYVGKDQMKKLTPKYKTEIERTIPTLQLELEGSFEEVMFDDTMWPHYNAWNYSIAAVKTYYNKSENVENKRILLLTDSMADVVSPFLVCGIKEVQEIDPRCFNGSIEAYIKEYSPDMVIMIYTARELGLEGAEMLYELY